MVPWRLFFLLTFLPLSGCVIVSANLDLFGSQPQPLVEQQVGGEGKAKILLLDISRVIGSADDDGPFGLSRRPALTTRIREELEQAEEDERIKAIVLRINSPGGTVTASDLIHHELAAFKSKRNLPIIAYALDFATSGAYYVALAADEIIVSPTTVTGSVGVILIGVNFSGLMDKLGVGNQTIKSGTLKDAGTPLRPMTPEDQALLQSVIDSMDQRFVGLVRERRPGMSDEAVRKISDGRIVTASEALGLGMVDKIGYFENALARARQRAGVEKARVIMYRRPNEYAENIYSRVTVPQPQVNLIHLDFGGWMRSPQFLYLWAPGAGVGSVQPELY